MKYVVKYMIDSRVYTAIVTADSPEEAASMVHMDGIISIEEV